MSHNTWTTRSIATERRTYCRPKNGRLETWDEVVDRAFLKHQRRLWEEAQGKELAPHQEAELQELASLGRQKKSLLAGRTLWLGGTEYAHTRALCNYNCSFNTVHSIYDLVDTGWNLLNGVGTGVTPSSGILQGYRKSVATIEIIPSEQPGDYKGRENNVETPPCSSNGYVWTIAVGDSAQAWAKAVGKLFKVYPRVDKLVLDYSEVRGPGKRLKNYAWICNGWKPLGDAMSAMHAIRNKRAGSLLTEIDILDVVNLFGTVLSSRRAAEAMLLDARHPRAQEFVEAKVDYWRKGLDHRRQSNNSITFWQKPSRAELASLLEVAFENGEPGFVNAAGALAKCPWWKGCLLYTSPSPRD